MFRTQLRDFSKPYDKIGFRSLSSVLGTQSPPVAPELFRRTCAKFATGITIVAVKGADDAPHGLTVNSFSSVSCDPPIVSVCIGLRCAVLPHLRACRHFSVNMLTETQRALSIRFAASPEGNFDGVDWHPGISGSPLLANVLAYLECRLERIVESGDHAILIARVERAECYQGKPLLYFNSQYSRLAD